jgi:tetratricopeptide (TPR) repeat protein
MLRKIGLCVAMTLLTCVCAQSQAPATQHVGLLDGPWEVLLDVPGFKIHQDGVMPDGRRYFYASNRENGVNVSVILENAKGPANKESCGNVLRRLAEGKRDTKLSDAGDRMTLEYTINIEGTDFRQRFFRVCIPYKEFYADLNFSKVGFQRGDEKHFQSVLDTLQFQERPAGSLESWELWKKGSAAFRSRNYRAAIEPYSRALELEKAGRQLPRDFWRVLIDNLGMAYGITGDLKNSKGVLEYGISQEATYPLFHYNLACAYAEMNDMRNAMTSLTRAFAHKENLIAGEKIPDPRGDDSFQRFMKNREFKDLVDALMKP